ncbi:SMI1/KNR4 family protein [Paenibacillus sp. GCM10028914]|uniref:SMI1/KNR4 family protein n=1 Tax=Paenibacillus sp. GCM10028914 TaxID=3273416 RepID=UPI00360F3A9E
MGLEKWTFVEESVDDATIALVEQLFEVTFPRDYKDCIKKFNGGYPEPNNFDYDNGAQGVFNDLISFTNSELNITMFHYLSEDSITKGIIPFGRDPFGNLICFDYRYTKESPSIVFYDHEEVGDESITLICESFSELLDKLYSMK